MTNVIVLQLWKRLQLYFIMVKYKNIDCTSLCYVAVSDRILEEEPTKRTCRDGNAFVTSQQAKLWDGIERNIWIWMSLYRIS